MLVFHCLKPRTRLLYRCLQSLPSDLLTSGRWGHVTPAAGSRFVYCTPIVDTSCRLLVGSPLKIRRVTIVLLSAVISCCMLWRNRHKLKFCNIVPHEVDAAAETFVQLLQPILIFTLYHSSESCPIVRIGLEKCFQNCLQIS